MVLFLMRVLDSKVAVAAAALYETEDAIASHSFGASPGQSAAVWTFALQLRLVLLRLNAPPPGTSTHRPSGAAHTNPTAAGQPGFWFHSSGAYCLIRSWIADTTAGASASFVLDKFWAAMYAATGTGTSRQASTMS